MTCTLATGISIPHKHLLLSTNGIAYMSVFLSFGNKTFLFYFIVYDSMKMLQLIMKGMMMRSKMLFVVPAWGCVSKCGGQWPWPCQWHYLGIRCCHPVREHGYNLPSCWSNGPQFIAKYVLLQTWKLLLTVVFAKVSNLTWDKKKHISQDHIIYIFLAL